MPRGRLLVLDDDATVGQILVMGAQRVDMEARLCEEADAFFALVVHWQPTHVAIDLTMPGLSGHQAITKLAELTCPAKVIISSGAGPAELEEALQQARSLGLTTAGALPKPFTLAALRALLEA